MITGAYDIGYCIKFPEIRAANFAGVGHSVSTECAHLFSKSELKVILLVSCITLLSISIQPSGAGTAFKILENFLGGQVNTLSNVLTLSHDMRDAFDRFAIWLEEVPGQVCHCSLKFSSRMTRQSNSRKTPIL
jgi:hypothetical protein